MARIYLIEDDPGMGDQLAQLLGNAGHTVARARCFDRLADDAIAVNPDLVVLDLGLPGTDGQYVAHDLRQRSQVPILVLTNRATDLDELMSLSMGADDFVSKSTNPQLILAHVDALLRRNARTSNDAALEWGGLTLDRARSQAAYAGRTADLTKNELRILDTLIRARGAIVSRERLMETLWATDAFVDDNTLTVNINRVRQKLTGIRARNMITTHRGQGYAMAEPITTDNSMIDGSMGKGTEADTEDSGQPNTGGIERTDDRR